MPKIDRRIANRFPDKVPQLKRVCEKAWIGDGLRKYLLRTTPMNKGKAKLQIVVNGINKLAYAWCH
jgi:hypothetical protein